MYRKVSSVGRAIGYGLNRGSIPRKSKRYEYRYFPQHPDWVRDPPSPLYNVYRGAASPGKKWPVREADHSPPFSAEVEITRAVPLLSYTFTCSGNFTFDTFTIYTWCDNLIPGMAL
jgi:hypothetical protein